MLNGVSTNIFKQDSTENRMESSGSSLGSKIQTITTSWKSAARQPNLSESERKSMGNGYQLIV